MVHMQAGTGEGSYTRHSSNQMRFYLAAYPSLKSVLETMNLEAFNGVNTVCIADFGSSTGRNSILQVYLIRQLLLTVVREAATADRPDPEFFVYFSDLPDNDFNTLFRLQAVMAGARSNDEASRRLDVDLEIVEEIVQLLGSPGVFLQDKPFLSAAVAGSFTQRLLPASSIHVAISCTALHWLSGLPRRLRLEQPVPDVRPLPVSGGINNPSAASIPLRLVNRNRVSAPRTREEDPEVFDAYREQAHTDLCSFLRARADEIVRGGLLWAMMGGADPLPAPSNEGTVHVAMEVDEWRDIVVVQGIRELEEEGELPPGTLENCNLPFFFRTKEDVENAVKAEEGLFSIRVLQLIPCPAAQKGEDPDAAATRLIDMFKAVSGPMLRDILGQKAEKKLFERADRLKGQWKGQLQGMSFHMLVMALQRL